ncbi:hypothetical protein P7K49_012455 [Saguinus oedipus]|uniref:Uncharacterized protein n=1 Tax=Saguinus oedipus TaxID=9490 RepID=A0ABQ9VTI0_SAGOE|nr:hypothetical protein P7K49_012455 [Saguinus oedipus]
MEAQRRGDCPRGRVAAPRPPPGRKRRCVSRPGASRALGPVCAGRRGLRSPEGPASLSRARILRSGPRRRLPSPAAALVGWPSPPSQAGGASRPGGDTQRELEAAARWSRRGLSAPGSRRVQPERVR